MINESQRSKADQSIFRWGGLAGIIGGVLLVAAFVPVALFGGGAPPTDPADAIARFPAIRVAQTVEEVLYLGVLALWAIHIVALYRALRPTSPAPALIGSALGLMGLVVLAAGALPQVATAPISDLYHAAGATPDDQATLVLLWQATGGMLDALLVTGLLLLPMGLVTLSVAMLRSPAFGLAYGRVGMLLGAAGTVAAGALLVQVSEIAVVVIFALIVFHLSVGGKLVGLSRGWSPLSRHATAS